MCLLLKLRKVQKKDWDFILKLRNRKETKKNFYNQKKISKAGHYAYLRNQEKNHDFFNWIICEDALNLGYVRILDNDISIMVDKKFQNKGISTKALKLVEIEARKLGLKKLIGRIMIHNKSSKKIFLKNNYKLLMYWLEKDIS